MSESGDEKGSADPGIDQKMRELAPRIPLALEPGGQEGFYEVAAVSTFLTPETPDPLAPEEKAIRQLIKSWVDFCSGYPSSSFNRNDLMKILDADPFYTLNKKLQMRYVKGSEPSSELAVSTPLESWKDFRDAFGPQPTNKDIKIEEQGSDSLILFSMGPLMMTILWNRLNSDKGDSSQTANRWAAIARKKKNKWKLTFVSPYGPDVPSINRSDRDEIKTLIRRWQRIPFLVAWNDLKNPPHKIVPELDKLLINKRAYAIMHEADYDLDEENSKRRLSKGNGEFLLLQKCFEAGKAKSPFDPFHVCPIGSSSPRHAVVAFSQTVHRKDKKKLCTLSNTMILKKDSNSWKIRMVSQEVPIIES